MEVSSMRKKSIMKKHVNKKKIKIKIKNKRPVIGWLGVP